MALSASKIKLDSFNNNLKSSSYFSFNNEHSSINLSLKKILINK